MISCEALHKCVDTSLLTLLYACQSATVWLFIKQLVLGLDVARRHVRQLHMARSGRSPQTCSKQAGEMRAVVSQGQAILWNLCFVELIAKLGKSDTHFSVNTGNKTCIYQRNYSDKHRLEVSHLSLHFAPFLAQIKVHKQAVTAEKAIVLNQSKFKLSP